MLGTSPRCYTHKFAAIKQLLSFRVGIKWGLNSLPQFFHFGQFRQAFYFDGLFTVECSYLNPHNGSKRHFSQNGIVFNSCFSVPWGFKRKINKVLAKDFLPSISYLQLILSNFILLENHSDYVENTVSQVPSE